MALRLFEDQGYDDTTMEQIAAAADVGTSTLYRYFPTKDSTLLDHPFLEARTVADLLADRPAGEPIDVALGHALADHLAALDHNIEDIARVRLQIDRNPAVRARVWDVWARHEALLEQAIADRLAASPDALEIQVAAHTTQMITQMALDQARSTVSPESLAVYAERVVALLDSGTVMLPRLPAQPGPGEQA
ncbi:TetR/AcrR family transcriptional regulator [Actinoplanes sp. RD1]|uniref:TetR/AcrR family transcriptional regulator n=1 Tax=Actinoplanes sp. RD1 TaxID=3064538 RepID=UPI002741FEF2|nr:TetR/AcrR family transcriptional regulator [Actinoplanes sp. RD1]